MAYHIDFNGDLVIDSFQNGIGSDPYTGLTDLRNINITSISGEASVAFQTAPVFNTPRGLSTTIVATGAQFAFSMSPTLPTLELNQAVQVTVTVGSGFSSGIYYIVLNNGTQIELGSGYGANTGIESSGSFTATVTTIDLALGPRSSLTPPISFNKNYMVESSYQVSGSGAGHGPFHWLLDSNGLVWSDVLLTGTTSSWTYIGNPTGGDTKGNGLIFLPTTRASTTAMDGWIFVWRNAQIDYLKVQSNGVNLAASSLSWEPDWQTLTGTPSGNDIPHEAIVAPNNTVVFCDGYQMGIFGQESLVVTFDPTNSATYFYNEFDSVVPVNDVALSLAYLNNQILIGAVLNRIYQWDAISFVNSPAAIIFLPENNTTSIVAVGQNAYIFTGNRGRIYQTNGSQASLWAKVPDHISGTVQPTLVWGGTCYNLNQLYFSLYNPAIDALGTINEYGAVWAIDINSQAMYVSNELSHGTYNGFASFIFPTTTQETFSGYGFYAGWFNAGNSISGVDITVNAPYQSGQSYIVSDLIPVGTLLRKMTPYQFEIKTSMPLLTGESITLSVGYSLADYTTGNMTFIGTLVGGSNTSGSNVIVSGNFPTTVENQQWLIIKAVLTGISSNPSYNRLFQIRIIGDTIKSNIPTQPYSIA